MQTQVYTPTLTNATEAVNRLQRITRTMLFVLLILASIGFNFAAAVLTGLMAGWLR